jgi:hypothetical protein
VRGLFERERQGALRLRPGARWMGYGGSRQVALDLSSPPSGASLSRPERVIRSQLKWPCNCATTDLSGACSRSSAIRSGLGSALYAAWQQTSVRIGSPIGARSHNRYDSTLYGSESSTYEISQHENRVRSVSRLSVGWRGVGQVARGLVLLEVSIFVFKDRLQVRTEKPNMNSHGI